MTDCKHERVEWVAECRCASMGFGHDRQGYICRKCKEFFGERFPDALSGKQEGK